MGFKCPLCFEDFLRDRDALQKHLDTAHYQIGADLLKLIEPCSKVDADTTKNKANGKS